MSNYEALYAHARRTIREADIKLNKIQLYGEPPRLNMHQDGTLPTCVYQPNTNTVAVCMAKLQTHSEEERLSIVLDAMAMCGCYRSYLLDKRVWNASQNKARIPVPALAMHGGVKWRFIRSKL